MNETMVTILKAIRNAKKAIQKTEGVINVTHRECGTIGFIINGRKFEMVIKEIK